MFMSLICVSSKDDTFVVNNKYEMNDGYIYGENDISVNTVAYQSTAEAIEDLKKKGYEFKEDNPYNSTSSFNFNTGDIFGDIFSFMNGAGVPPEKDYEQKRKEAENMKNDMLSQILNGMR